MASEIHRNVNAREQMNVLFGLSAGWMTASAFWTGVMIASPKLFFTSSVNQNAEKKEYEQ